MGTTAQLHHASSVEEHVDKAVEGMAAAGKGLLDDASVGVAVVSGGKRCRQASAKGRVPERTCHAVDIENLAGAAAPSLGQVQEVRAAYAERLACRAADQVVIASSHRTLLNAALGWPHARYRVRSGPDGADLELLDVLRHENIAARFTHVAIGSGDGAFAYAAASLAAAGVRVTVVSRRRSLSPRLELAAHEVIYIDEPAAAAASLLPPEAACGAGQVGAQRRMPPRPPLSIGLPTPDPGDNAVPVVSTRSKGRER